MRAAYRIFISTEAASWFKVELVGTPPSSLTVFHLLILRFGRWRIRLSINKAVTTPRTRDCIGVIWIIAGGTLRGILLIIII